jgi:hypothetical protein
MMLPQAQTMRAAWYSGWIPAYIFGSWSVGENGSS